MYIEKGKVFTKHHYLQILNQNNIVEEKINNIKSSHSDPLVSICVSHYNYGKYLPYTLDSILKSKYSDYEVIVVDDASTDIDSIIAFENLKDMYNFQNWSFIKKNDNTGAADTKNFAAKNAKGELLLFIDGDDVIFPSTVEDFVYALLKNKLDCVTSYFQNFIGEKEILTNNTLNTIVLPGPILELAVIENVFGASNFIVRRETFFEVGGFPIERVLYEDWAFLMRLVLMGYIMDIIPISLFGYRRKEGSRSETTDKNESIFNTAKYYYDFIPKHQKNLFDILIISKNNVI